MKTIILTALIALAGCAGQTTLEELEQEALATGNWTEVEQRELALMRKGESQGRRCPDGFVYVCLESGMDADCECVPTRWR